MVDANLITRGTEQRFSIKNGQAGIGLNTNDIGNWSRLKLGFRGAININYGVLSFPPFFIGLCNGTSNMFLDLSTDHFIGMSISDSSYNWVHQGDNLYRESHIMCKFIKKESSSLEQIYDATYNGNIVINRTIINDIGTETENCFSIVLDLKKNGNDLDCIIYYNDDLNSTASLLDFELQLNSKGGTFGYFNESSTGTITSFDESTYGLLDTLNIGWNSTQWNLEINDIGYSVLER